jgi:hypothetical protein
MTTETTVAKLGTPDAAIRAAIAQFPSQADFWRALNVKLREKGISITRASVSQWVRRRNGAPADVCPAIESISGVACELLCPTTDWAELRKNSSPPTYVPRQAATTA